MIDILVVQETLIALIMQLHEFLLLILFLKGSATYTATECLNVTQIDDLYVISCHIQELEFEVFFNHLEFEVASCIPPHPYPSCRCYYKNGWVTQNLSTEETVLTVTESLDYPIYGEWTCVHGRKENSERWSVNIPKPHQIDFTTTVAYSNAFVDIISSPHRLCIMFYSVVGMLTSMIINILGISILRVIKVEWATKIKHKTSIITYGVIDVLTKCCGCIQDRKPKSIIVLTYVIQVILMLVCIGIPFLSNKDAMGPCTDYAFGYGILEFALISIILVTFYRETKEEKYDCEQTIPLQKIDTNALLL